MPHLNRTSHLRRAFVILAAIALPCVIFASGASASTHAVTAVNSSAYHKLTFTADSRDVSLTGTFNPSNPKVGQYQNVVSVFTIGHRSVGSLRGTCYLIKITNNALIFHCQNGHLHILGLTLLVNATFSTALPSFIVHLTGYGKSRGVYGHALDTFTSNTTDRWDFTLYIPRCEKE